MKTTHTLCLSLLGLALMAGSLTVYSHETGAVNIILAGSAPRDTIGIVAYSGGLTLDSKTLSDKTVDVVVNARENVAVSLSAPDDTTVRVVMTMAIEDMVPAPESGVPDGVSIEMVNPSILADGTSGARKMEASDVKLTSLTMAKDSASNKTDSLLSHHKVMVRQKAAKK